MSISAQIVQWLTETAENPDIISAFQFKYTFIRLKGSGADFLDKYKPYIEDGQTVITSPHKIYGPEANDLVLQLRKQRIIRVILAGMSGNLCVESHMHELIEQRFEVAVIHDATASAKMNDLDGDKAAKINFRMIASASWSTNETVDKMKSIHR